MFANAKTPTGASYPKINEEGSYTVKIIEASWVKTLAGTASQGKVQVEVIEASTHDDSAVRSVVVVRPHVVIRY